MYVQLDKYLADGIDQDQEDIPGDMTRENRAAVLA
jgi:hypothetical protein